jgi:hypothetical protein
MDAETVPYRAQGARPKLTDAERRWFTKQGDAVKGPYPAESLARSLKGGVLKPSSLVRAEDEVEWRPLRTVDAVMDAVRGPKGPGWTPDPRVGAETQERFAGNLQRGFAAGFVGGLLGLILVLLLARGHETKRGAVFGFGLQLVFGILLQLLATK